MVGSRTAMGARNGSVAVGSACEVDTPFLRPEVDTDNLSNEPQTQLPVSVAPPFEPRSLSSTWPWRLCTFLVLRFPFRCKASFLRRKRCATSLPNAWKLLYFSSLDVRLAQFCVLFENSKEKHSWVVSEPRDPFCNVC